MGEGRKETIVVNLFGGPGCSKSTTAAGVFSLLKLHGVNCELVTEYAKDLVWEERHKTFDNQLYIFSKQFHRLDRVNGKVDVIITDSPIALSFIYGNDGTPKALHPLVEELFKKFDNVNILLNRKKPYNPVGRLQTEDEAKEVDNQIRDILDYKDILYQEVDGDYTAINTISYIILGMLGKELEYSISK